MDWGCNKSLFKCPAHIEYLCSCLAGSLPCIHPFYNASISSWQHSIKNRYYMSRRWCYYSNPIDSNGYIFRQTRFIALMGPIMDWSHVRWITEPLESSSHSIFRDTVKPNDSLEQFLQDPWEPLVQQIYYFMKSAEVMGSVFGSMRAHTHTHTPVSLITAMGV